MGKRKYTAGLSNERLGRKESMRYQQAQRGNAVSAKMMLRALVWVSENPRYWRKLCRLFRRYGMTTDASVLNWLLRDARDTVDGCSMRRIAELAHELVKLARVQEVIADN